METITLNKEHFVILTTMLFDALCHLKDLDPDSNDITESNMSATVGLATAYGLTADELIDCHKHTISFNLSDLPGVNNIESTILN